MEKVKEFSERKMFYRIAAAAVVLSIALAAIAHADDGKGRDERGDRGERGIHSLFSLVFNAENDVTARIDGDRVRVHGATVTATSSAGFTATTQTPAMTFNVETDSNTKFEFRGKGRGSLVNLAVGDSVNFRGLILSGTTSTLTVKATNVEDKTHRLRPPRPHATTTVSATTTAELRINTLERLIERLEAMIEKLKLRFGL